MSSNLAVRLPESPSKPEAEDLTSLESVSSVSKGSTGSPLNNNGLGSFCDEDDPILNGRSEVGVGEWTIEEQEEFIAHLLFHTEGKQFTEEEFLLIRSEVQQAGLPLDIVDRLSEEHKRQYQLQEQLLSKHTNEAFETIEDVDESDNILAYFSRMSTLKHGGHFPSLNTDAINSFVDDESCTDDIEVDLDVGYVNKSLDLTLDETDLLHDESWERSDDGSSQGSSAIDLRNAYDMGNAFESLLVGGASRKRQEEEDELDSLEKDRRGGPDQLDNVSTQTEDDWAPQVARPSRTYRYGYEHDLAEWKRKTNTALWKPCSQVRSRFGTSLFTCQGMAESVMADELNGLLWGMKRPPRLQGMTAVKKLLNEAGDRRKRQHNRNQHRHIPEEIEAAPKPWQLPYRERCKWSEGYIGVDHFSLLDSSAAIQPLDSRDNCPWETRDVRQHFLHDRSISLSCNWFGRLRRKRGNDPNMCRPCRPNTMGMPKGHSQATSTNFDDCEWTDAPSKSTSKSCNSGVNRTVSLSSTSGDGSCQSPSNTDEDCESSTHSTHDHSRSSDSNNEDDETTAFYTEGGNSKKMQVDFGSLIGSLMSGDETYSSLSNLKGAGYGTPWMADDEFDTESLGAHSDGVNSEDDTTDPHNISSFSQTSGAPSSSGSDDSRSSSMESSGSFCTEDSESTSSGSDGSWEDAPECGTLVNVKPKLGERVSRVTPDHTSHLLRSRFRKKYTPRGSLFGF